MRQPIGYTVGILAATMTALAAAGGDGASADSAGSMPAAVQYEGLLLDGGVALEGLVDLEFRAFDAPWAGGQAGPTLFADDVPVEQGRFTVTLDFGGFAFDPAAHWLEIRGDGRVLGPRRRVMPVFDVGLPEAGAEAPAPADGATDEAQPADGRAIGGAAPRRPSARPDLHDPGEFWNLGDEDPEESPLTAEGNDDGGEGPGDGGGDGIWNTRGREYYYRDGNVGIGTSNPAHALDIRAEGGRALNVENKETSGTRYAVYAKTKSSRGRGVYGYASDTEGGGYGVWGRSNGARGIGVFALAGSSSGSNYGLYAQTKSIGGYAAFITTSLASGNVARINRYGDQGVSADALEITIGAGSVDSSQYIECERAGDVDFRVWADGDVTADGMFTSGGADLAEMLPVSTGAASVEPGDVLVIDTERAGALVISAVARSPLVAGIYSTRPGVLASEHDWDAVEQMLYGQTGEGEEGPTVKPLELGAMLDEVPLAVVGIVPCKVSAENGPIRIGDLLVTSATPGHAMRDPDARPGTIVGKAMGELEAGTGVIRILMSLQ